MRRNLLRVSLSIGILAASTAAACLSSSSGGPSGASPEGGSGSSGSTSGGSTSSGSSSGSASGSGSSSGAAEAGGTVNIPLVVTSTGYTTASAINLAGAWFAYGDELGSNGLPPGDCQTAGFTTAQCSSITFPPGPSTGPEAGPATFPPDPPNPLGTMCLSGVGAQVPAVGATFAYSAVFGIGIGLDFNNPSGTVMPFDASKIVALTFTVAGLPTDPNTRVNIEFQEPATDVAPNDAWAYQILANGPTTVNLTAGVGGQLSPAFPTPTGDTQPAFDPTMLEGIQFHVVTNTSNPINVTAFCISDLTAVVSE